MSLSATNLDEISADSDFHLRELYFKMGIAAMVGGLLAVVVGLRAFRRRFYEMFLILHIIGAVLMLMGSWYRALPLLSLCDDRAELTCSLPRADRPIMTPWVYAGVAVWVFERAVRLALHVASRFHSRLILHRPLIQAEASVCHGAIRLSVPFPSGKWEAGQHA